MSSLQSGRDAWLKLNRPKRAVKTTEVDMVELQRGFQISVWITWRTKYLYRTAYHISSGFSEVMQQFAFFVMPVKVNWNDLTGKIVDFRDQEIPEVDTICK